MIPSDLTEKRYEVLFRSFTLLLLLGALAVALFGDASVRTSATGDARLQRAGASIDLTCRFARGDVTPILRRDASLAAACSAEPGDSAARIVAVGEDRRRAYLLRANRHREIQVEPGSATRLRFSVSVRGQGDILDVAIVAGDGVAKWERRLAQADGWVDGEIALPSDAPSRLSVRVEAKASRRRDRDARLAFAAPRLIEPPDRTPGRVPNIVLYMIDTLRADHTTVYGYERPTTPRLQELADRSVVFDRAYSTAARTRPAAASALTGLYPSQHNARLGRGIDPSEETLAERLRADGWSTWAWVANGNVFASGYAFDQGFDRFYAVRGERMDHHARTGEINDSMLPILRDHADEPFFLYVHAIDPHSPYDPPEEFAGAFRDPDYTGGLLPTETRSRILRERVSSEEDIAWVRDLYDEDILYQDAMLGELVDTLEDLDLTDRTLLLVVSDHGDEFMDHGDWEHGNRLFEEQIRIPFLLHVPAQAGGKARRIFAPISLADLTPTLLGLYGLDSLADVAGRDLSDEVLGAGSRPEEVPIYVEEATNMEGGDLRSWTEGPWKLIRRAGGLVDDEATTYRLFQLERDPGEKVDVSALYPHRVSTMRDKLLAKARQIARPVAADREPVKLDDRTRRQLQALGYLTP